MLLFLATLIALTIDDHPLPTTPLFTAEQRAERAIHACAVHKCKAAFFCVGTDEGLERLNRHGHYLANHSLTHRHLSSISLEEFAQDLLAMEGLLAPFENFRPWFRYPYLDYGNRTYLGGSHEKYTAAKQLLEELGYVHGYVTINTFDWHINRRLLEAVCDGRAIDLNALKEVYVHLVERWCTYFIEAYPEDVVHTLLLHANDLNALYLDDVLTMIEENGWTLVDPELAFADPSWKETFYLEAMPPTLNTQTIDLYLDRYHVFH